MSAAAKSTGLPTKGKQATRLYCKAVSLHVLIWREALRHRSRSQTAGRGAARGNPAPGSVQRQKKSRSSTLPCTKPVHCGEFPTDSNPLHALA
eukprot:3115283-Pleurochrysis_carterae.AAC.1